MNMARIAKPNKPFAATFGFPPQPRTRMLLRGTTNTAPMPAKLVQRAAAKIVATYDPARVVALRHSLVALGYRFVTVLTNNKKCIITDWSELTFNPNDFDPRHASTGILLNGRIVVIDIDTGYLPHVEILLEIISKIAPGGVIRWRENSARLALIFRMADGESIRKVSDLLVKMEDEFDEWGKSKEPKFEILTGGFLHIDGERAGHRLELIQHDGLPGLPDVNNLPILTQTQVDRIRAEIIARGLSNSMALAVTPLAIPSQSTTPKPALGTFAPLNIATIKDGLYAVVAAQVSFGNAEFENLVSGAINEARIAGSPGDVQAVAQLLEGSLSQLAGWNPVADPKRIASFTTANMPANPRRMGSFIATVNALVGSQWQNGLGTAQAAQMNVSAKPPVASGVMASTSAARRIFMKGGQIAGAARPRFRLGDSPLVKAVGGLLVGRGGAIKSTLAVHIAFGIAAGGPSPLGWTFDEPQIARFVTGEDDAIDIGRTVQALSAHYGHVPTSLEVCDATCAAGLRLVDATQRGGWTLNAEGVATLRDMAEGAAFLAVDSLSILCGVSINDNAAMAAVQGEVNRIANASGALILVLHHRRKGDDDDRGTEAAADGSMGAANVVNMSRLVLESRTMSEAEAKERGIQNDRHRFAGVRVVKSNYGGVSDDPHWLEKRIVDIQTPGGAAKAVKLEHRVMPKLAATAALSAVRQIAMDLIKAAEVAKQPLANNPTHKRSGRRAVALELMKQGHANGMTADKVASTTLKALLLGGLIVLDTTCSMGRAGGGSRDYTGLRVAAGNSVP